MPQRADLAQLGPGLRILGRIRRGVPRGISSWTGRSSARPGWRSCGTGRGVGPGSRREETTRAVSTGRVSGRQGHVESPAREGRGAPVSPIGDHRAYSDGVHRPSPAWPATSGHGGVILQHDPLASDAEDADRLVRRRRGGRSRDAAAQEQPGRATPTRHAPSRRRLSERPPLPPARQAIA